MSKVSVIEIAKDYFYTLHNGQTKKVHLPDIILQIVLPIFVGLLSFVTSWHICETSNAVVGVSIVSALLCAMATLLFQIRIDMGDKVRSEENHDLLKKDLDLVDELFSAVLWGILFGFALALAMIVLEWLGILGSDTEPLASRIVSALLVSCVCHFSLIVCMILKRLRRVYLITSRGER